MEKIQPTREQIIEDVRLWSKHFLEVPNIHLGGFPACPFAKKDRSNIINVNMLFCHPNLIHYFFTFNKIKASK